MCAYFTCAAFNNLEAGIYECNGYIYLSLQSGKASTHITLNANQARLLGEVLQNVSGQVLLEDMQECSRLFGDLTVSYEEQPQGEVPVALPIKAA